MRKIVLISTTALLLTCISGFKLKSPESHFINNNKTVLISDIEYKNGIYLYEKRIFNGNIIAYYENKTLKYKSEVFDGRLHGLSTEYYSNGNVKGERNFYLGKLFGSFTEYFQNGEKRIHGQVKDINYHGGEEIEQLSFSTLKKGKVKSQKIKKGKIIFINAEGEHYESSEEVPIYLQNHYIITTLDEQKILIEVK